MSTTKKDIVKHIADEFGLSQIDTKNVVQEFLDTVTRTLVTEGRLELRDFGVFSVKQRARRKARNPKTGEEVTVPPRKVVTFKPGKQLREKVRQTEEREQPPRSFDLA